MLIAGCSHTAGSEIDGETDSPYNRQHSYGNLLANKLGYAPVNIAVCGYTNSAIARSVLEWFSQHDTTDLDIFVLVGWTESVRIEAPFEFPTWHNKLNGQYCDWFSESSTDFLQITVLHKGYSDREKDIQEDYQTFMVRQSPYLEVVSANLVLQLQYFLKHKNVPYLMLNAGYMFSESNQKYLKVYHQMIDKNRYYKFDNNHESFYSKFKRLGYKNNIAKYDHHGEEPHNLYSEELYKYITEKQ
jgi:hypothetical protein